MHDRAKVRQATTEIKSSGATSIFEDITGKVRTKLSHSRQTIRSVMALLSSNITASILVAFGGLLVARFLGPEETGAFRAYTIPLTYLIFLHLGTWDGLWRQIPYYTGKEMPEKVEAVAAAGGAFNIFLSCAVSLGFVCMAAYCLIHRDMQGVFGWLAQAVFCWGVFYGNYLSSTYRTLNHFVTLARIQIIQNILSFGMVFLLPFLKFYGLCARYAVPSILQIWLFHRKRPLKIKYRFKADALKELIKVGLPFSIWGNLETSIWVATESALVLTLSGVSALGLFAVAVIMRAAMNTLPASIWQVLTPRVVTNMARDRSIRGAATRLAGVTAGLTGFMILLALAGAFLLEVFVPVLIPKYVAGIQVMKICLWFPVIQAAFLPMNTLFAAGKPWLYGRGVIAGIIVFPVTVYLLYPAIGGLLAVAAGSLAGRTARTLAAYVDLAVLTKREI